MSKPSAVKPLPLRNLNLDFLRVIAAIGVVIIHTDNITSVVNDYVGGGSWWLSNALVTISLSAVPLFIMLSGALLIPRAQSNWNNMFSRLTHRLLIPLFAWHFIYFGWRISFHREGWGFFEMVQSMFGHGYHHLYYLWILAGLYLVLPLLQDFFSRWDRSHVRAVVIGVLSLSMIQTILEFLLFDQPMFLPIAWKFVPYMSYALLGALLITAKKSSLPTLKTILISLGTLLIAHTVLRYGILSLSERGENPVLWGYHVRDFFLAHFHPLIVVQTILSFLCIVQLELERLPMFIKHMVTNLSALCFGMYLIHPMMIEIVDAVIFPPLHTISDNLWFYSITRILTVILLSSMVAWIFKKIASTRFLVGER